MSQSTLPHIICTVDTPPGLILVLVLRKEAIFVVPVLRILEKLPCIIDVQLGPRQREAAAALTLVPTVPGTQLERAVWDDAA